MLGCQDCPGCAFVYVVVYMARNSKRLQDGAGSGIAKCHEIERTDTSSDNNKIVMENSASGGMI